MTTGPDLKAISATPGGAAATTRSHTVAKLIDTTSCIGCKACEVACQEWNNQQFTIGNFEGTYQTRPDLSHNFWNLIKFNEIEDEGQPVWLMAKYQCMHCVEPGCLRACPAPGAIVQHGNGIAGVYDPQGVGGTHVLYVLARADRPEDYGLPKDPRIPWTVSLWKGPVKWLGNALLLGGILGTMLHYLRYGPRLYRENEDG